MNKFTMSLLALALPLLPLTNAVGQEAREQFSFITNSISGFQGAGEVSLTGGGAYDLAIGFAHSGGSFSCKHDVTTGKLAGCKQGEGVRWDVVAVLDHVDFKCTGAATEAKKTAVTDDDTVALIADFYRQGDGNDESFTAKMFVSKNDEARDFDGNQNIWIESVGCGDAAVNFN